MKKRKHAADGRDGIPRDTLIWLLVAQAVSIFPLFFYLSPWIPIVWLTALIWRIQIHRGAWAYPSSWVKVCLGIVCVAGVYLSYAGSLGVEPMVAFLLVSFTLKLIEVRKRGDILIVLAVGFFAIAAHFLFNQVIWAAVYGLVASVVLLSAWETVFRGRSRSIKEQLRSASGVLAQAIPLFLILFLVVPRINPLWTIPSIQKTGVTGFSESMSPGDISQLAQSGATAFRVSFSGTARPAPSELYWRGLILKDFNGRQWYGLDTTWFNPDVVESYRPNPEWELEVQEGTSTYDYKVLLEPHFRQWLFTLLAPTELSSSFADTGFSIGLTALAKLPVSSRIEYEATAKNLYLTQRQGLSERWEKRFLRLPKNYNPQTLTLAQSWVDDGFTESEIVNKALGFYRQNFTYSLQPPRLGRDSVDEFLFSTQKGFCEHFSSSFVVLMRAAGIPARVVLGYQGGEWAGDNEYLIVKQSDAHSWAEVWLEGRGWVMLDPTSAVSPDRIELGINNALAPEDSALIAGAAFRSGALSWVGAMQRYVDMLDYQWSQWVLSYDNDMQQSLLTRLLGSLDAWRMVSFVVGGGAAILFLYLLLYNLRFGGASYSVEQKLYYKLQKKIESRGVTLAPGETPSEYLARAAEGIPQWRAQLDEIKTLYYAVSYQSSEVSLPKLKEKIGQLV